MRYPLYYVADAEADAKSPSAWLPRMHALEPGERRAPTPKPKRSCGKESPLDANETAQLNFALHVRVWRRWARLMIVKAGGRWSERRARVCRSWRPPNKGTMQRSGFLRIGHINL